MNYLVIKIIVFASCFCLFSCGLSYKYYEIKKEKIVKYKRSNRLIFKTTALGKIQGKIHVYYTDSIFNMDSNVSQKHIALILNKETNGRSTLHDFYKINDARIDSIHILVLTRHRVRDGASTLVLYKSKNYMIWQEFSGQFSPTFILPEKL